MQDQYYHMYKLLNKEAKVNVKKIQNRQKKTLKRNHYSAQITTKDTQYKVCCE